MGCCACGKGEWSDEVFIKRSDRKCTNVFCLAMIVAMWAGIGAIVGTSINREPDLLWSLLYPTDAYGQHCGRKGTEVEHLPKMMYPDLDSDFERQAYLRITTTQ